MTSHDIRLTRAAAALQAAGAPMICKEAGDPLDVLAKSVGDHIGTVNEQLTNIDTKLTGMTHRMDEIEQKNALSRRGRGRGVPMTWGQSVTGSDDYRSFIGGSCRGRAKIEVKALTSAGTSAGALIVPERDPVAALLARRRMTIRSLLGQGRTESNAVEYVRETVFTNNADSVSEGAQKPESDIQYELQTAAVKTIAHWIPASRQAIEDAPQLESMVDNTLRYGLAYREEAQLLYGDGTGAFLEGMVTVATAFDGTRVASGDTDFDIIRHAISQAEEADLPASGIILNTRDWMDMMGIKDNEGQYIGAGPFGATVGTLWQLPVVWTNALGRGEFLVGAFDTATQIYDRMDPEVMIASEDRDNFIKNMLTIRAEHRLAFAVKRPQAIIHGTALPSYSVSSGA